MYEDLVHLTLSNDFWQKSRDELLLKMIRKNPVLEVGCGTGVVTKNLLKNGFEVYSIDIDKRAYNYTRKFNKNTYCLDFTKKIDPSIIKKLPKFSTIVFPDSLEHMKKDVSALKNANKLLRKNGSVVISVPYHNFYWTKNDEYRGHYRRYSRRELALKLRKTGFKIKKFRFFAFLCLPPILFAKYIKQRIPHEKISKSKLNWLLYKILKLENLFPVPTGSTLICSAVKIREISE